MQPGSRHAQVVVDGAIDVPVLTLHGLGDLFVPFSMEQQYAARVAGHGKSNLLVQRAIRAQNHCAFTTDELATAFADLVHWVEDGVKPAGDDVLNATAVAAPDFGCAFTSEDRLYPAPISIPPARNPLAKTYAPSLARSHRCTVRAPSIVSHPQGLAPRHQHART